MYKCVTGMIEEKANGCIMADEMGLGKTLQCITLMWTLLKQSPDAGKSTIQKAIIACPSSLVRNWANELVKWLGPDAIQPFAIDGKATKEELTQQLRQWAIASGRAITRPVIIVSYETLRLNVDELKNTQIGLMLCDEGHRLKNGDSQTFTALNNLKVSRRVILSGTPIQNDLSEYFSLISFANPGLLGSRPEFRKRFELPILRGRDAAGSEQDRERGDQCLRELLALVNKFIIRRTNDILSKYLQSSTNMLCFVILHHSNSIFTTTSSLVQISKHCSEEKEVSLSRQLASLKNFAITQTYSISPMTFRDASDIGRMIMSRRKLEAGTETSNRGTRARCEYSIGCLLVFDRIQMIRLS